MKMTRWIAGMALVAAFVLAGCGSDAGTEAEPTATAPPVATVTPTPAPAVTLGEVVWTTDVDPASGAPVGELTALPNDAERVVAVVPAPSLPAGTVVQARWTIDGEPLPELDPAPVTVDESRADAWLSWSLTWTAEQPWPIGRLGISIEVNGEVQREGEIRIVRAQRSSSPDDIG
jgi:hypothetical protein